MTVQIAGEVGPFLDNVQMRQVSVVVQATCDFTTMGPPGNPGQIDQHVQGQLLRAMRDVIGPKMASGQLSFRHLGMGETAAIIPEIIAVSGLAQSGVQVGSLSMAFGIDGRAPQRPKAAPQSPPMPNVRANIHVGGFNIKASTDGGLDTAGLQNQLVDKAKSTLMWWAFGAAILLVVVLGVAGLGFYIWRSATSTTSPAAAGAATATQWDGKTPLVCGGNSVMTVNGVTANLSGTAITASANCQLTLVNVNVTAATAIEAGGNASVTVTGGSLNGSTLAVHATAASKVIMAGTKVTGKTQATAAAKITGP